MIGAPSPAGAFASAMQVGRRGVHEFFERVLRFRPTHQQRLVLDAVQAEHQMPIPQRRKKFAVRSGQGTGKSALSGGITLWRVFQRVDSLATVTAPTQRQVRDVFMGELRRTLDGAIPELHQYLDVSNFRISVVGRPNWGIKTVPANKPENVQGYHSEPQTYVFDEASGIQQQIWEAVDGGLSGQDTFWFAIGNPNFRQGGFADCFTRHREKWHTFRWNAEECPLVSREAIKQHAEKYGIESDFYRVRVLGDFPASDPDAIVALEDVEACTRLRADVLAREPINEHGSMRQIGLDLARYGADESVIVARRGRAVVAFECYQKREPVDAIRRAFVLQRDLGWSDEDTFYVVDAGGIGQGAVSHLYEANKNVHEFHSSGVPQNQDEFADKISEAWFGLRELVRNRACYLPIDDRLLGQLTTRKFKMNKKGKIQVEDKKDYKERLDTEEATSPDRADGVVMAFYTGNVAAAQVTRPHVGATLHRQRLHG